MPNYELNIVFEKSSLETIYAVKQKVTIVKQTDGGSSVAWVAFAPFEANTVQWENQYALYCSTSEVQAGAKIRKLTDEMAFDGLLYDFSSAIFHNPRSDNMVSPNTYGVWNYMEDYESLTFGLAQSVQANNKAFVNSPINAQSVPRNEFVHFQPYEVIEVFMESQSDNGMVISTIRSKPITIKYVGSTVSQTIAFNPVTNSFFFA